MALYDRVRFTTATTGTGTITVGTAIAGFRTPAGASVPDSGTFPYVIEDGAAWEVGTGTYTVAGTTVARVLIASSTGSLLTLSGSAVMYCSLSAAYLVATFAGLASPTFTGTLSATHIAASGRGVFASGIRATGFDFTSTAGLGGELLVSGGEVNLNSFNRSTSGFAVLNLQGSTVKINPGGTLAATIDSTGLTIVGVSNSSGNQLISGTGAQGYATGSGGTVTQITSKGTGVTLSKTNGQIVTSNAALATVTVVSFTVTNTTVAATDTINLNLASGNVTAGTYRYWVDKISAGSFVIAIENRSAGSLSEALTFNFAVVKAVTA